MADASHLEKMGRELKCPICLSLLKCAASITCNHVFCNSCIVKSMKEESKCPVCKIPFHRREIRLAPHMDNLVSIYKSMEIASGVNMFMSESAPSGQLPGEACIHVQNEPQTSSANHVWSSFLSKKRVQVAQYPLPETPVHSAKVGSRVSECMPGVDKNEKGTLISNHNQSDVSGTRLSPFFWLRDDEDAENLSQQSDRTFDVDVTPAVALSFSDMKDSDDEGSPGLENAQGHIHGKFPAVDLSDNDMLDWTQRPCSPELCSKATKLQIKASQDDQLKVALQVRDTYEPHPTTDASNLILVQGTKLTTMNRIDSDVNKQLKAQNPTKRKKNTRSTRTTSKETALSLGTCDVDGILKNQDPASELAKNEKARKRSNNSSILHSEEKASKRRKKTAKIESTADLALESIPSAPTGKSWYPTDKNVDVELPNLPVKSNKCTGSETSNIITRIKSKNMSDSCLRSGKQQCEPSNILKFKDLTENDNNGSNVEASPVCMINNNFTLRKRRSESQNELSEAKKKGSRLAVPSVRVTKSCLRSRIQKPKGMMDGSPKIFTRNEINRKDHDHFQALQEDSCLRSSSRQYDMSTLTPIKYLSDVEDSPLIPSFAMADNHLSSGEKRGKRGEYSSDTSRTKETRNSERLKESSESISCNASITLDMPSNDVTVKNVLENSGEAANNSIVQGKSQSLVYQKPLRNCESNLTKIQCAFCQSAEDSKPYGKMIHYFDGRPVSTDHRGGSNSIHCHQICAEWAPNVYFENDAAINLKAELARSRRISCSCCGVKGAALGCYYKSCHKSFHVPCAKMMPECRWDTENYVMLCPLHASSNLPSEISGSQRKRKSISENKRTEKRTMTMGIPKSDWKGSPHSSPEKLVLCCSGLAASDKDIVCQFRMISGARESKKWCSSVTHVIASVDENAGCRRTLKILMGIMEGKWILNVKWLKACIDAKRLVAEHQYEITTDTHGIKKGPRLGRLRVLNKKPKLFHGLEFYFHGEFAASYKGYLHDLITAGGGTILHRKPIVADQSRPSTFIIYNLELPDKYDPSKRISEANALANMTGAKVVSNAWILNSIAACELQKHKDE